MNVETSNLVCRLIIASPSLRTNQFLKGTWSSRDQFCTQNYDLEKLRHVRPDRALRALSSAADGGPVFIAPTTVHANHTKHQSSNSTRSICPGFVANLFVKHVDNKSNQRSLSLTVHVCAKNRQLSVCVAKCFQYRQTLVAW